MKDEISVAVRFLTNIIEINNSNNIIKNDQLETFKVRLIEVLSERFQNHWFPEKPNRGQGYRCIRLNGCDRKDPGIKQAAEQSGLTYEQLRLPYELTIWVDPKEVCCRFGEHQGSFCTLATSKNGNWEILLDAVNLEEIQKKTLELKDKVAQAMSTRKNGRRGFLPATHTSSPSYKASRAYNTNGYTLQTPPGHHHHSSPSPSSVNWSQNHSTPLEMFSSSPPNQYSMYNLGKFSPPKYGYGTSSKWSTPITHPSYGPAIPPGKGDKYHWFNSGKATVKA